MVRIPSCVNRELLPVCGDSQNSTPLNRCKPYSKAALALTSQEKERTRNAEVRGEASPFDILHSHLICNPGGCTPTSINQINSRLTDDSAYFPSMAISGTRMFVSFLYGHGDDAELVIVECDTEGRNCSDPVTVTDPNRSNPLDASIAIIDDGSVKKVGIVYSDDLNGTSRNHDLWFKTAIIGQGPLEFTSDPINLSKDAAGSAGSQLSCYGEVCLASGHNTGPGFPHPLAWASLNGGLLWEGPILLDELGFLPLSTSSATALLGYDPACDLTIGSINPAVNPNASYAACVYSIKDNRPETNAVITTCNFPMISSNCNIENLSVNMTQAARLPATPYVVADAGSPEEITPGQDDVELSGSGLYCTRFRYNIEI